MDKLRKSGVYFFCIIAGCLASIGAWRWIAKSDTTGPGSRLRPDAAVKSFGTVALGADFRLPFSIRNDSADSLQVLGYIGVCTPQGCVDVDGTPVVVPPHASRTVTLHGTTRATGAFSGSITLLTTCEINPKIGLQVVGRVGEAALDESRH